MSHGQPVALPEGFDPSDDPEMWAGLSCSIEDFLIFEQLENPTGKDD